MPLQNSINSNPIPSLRAPYRMPNTQVGMANVRAGLANFKVAFIGDSFFCGNFSNGSVWNSNRALTIPMMIAPILTSAGIPASTDAMVADQGASTHTGTLNGYDTRVTVGASWLNASSAVTTGGNLINNSTSGLGSAAAETFTLTPAESFDTLDYYYYFQTATAGYTLDLGGSALLTITASSGDNTIKKATITKTAGTGVAHLIRTSNATIVFMGMHPYLSTNKSVQILNMGNSGTRTSTWATQSGPYATFAGLTLWAPQLSIVMLGINDAFDGRTQSAIATDLTAICTRCLTLGDALLVAQPLVETAFATLANQAAARAAVYQVGAAMGINVLDLNARWVSYANAAALNYFYVADGTTVNRVHPVQLGYQDMANAIASVLLSN